jgi:hypothetical protein
MRLRALGRTYMWERERVANGHAFVWSRSWLLLGQHPYLLPETGTQAVLLGF